MSICLASTSLWIQIKRSNPVISSWHHPHDAGLWSSFEISLSRGAQASSVMSHTCSQTPWFRNHPPGTTFIPWSLELFQQHCVSLVGSGPTLLAWLLLLGYADVQRGLWSTWWALQAPSSLQILLLFRWRLSFCSAPTGLAVLSGVATGLPARVSHQTPPQRH